MAGGNAVLAFCVGRPPQGFAPRGPSLEWSQTGEAFRKWGAVITLLSAEGRILQQAYTSEKGGFLLGRISPGLYSLRVTLTSFPAPVEGKHSDPARRPLFSFRESVVAV